MNKGKFDKNQKYIKLRNYFIMTNNNRLHRKFSPQRTKKKNDP